jgi:hypothetical protein
MTGQTDLFKSKRQRGTKPPPPLEFPVHCMIADTLNRWLCGGWIWFHCPSGELRQIQTAKKLKRMGVKKGVADFLLVEPVRGRLHALELKRLGEKPTDEQERFGSDLRAAGGVWAWTDSYVGAIVILKCWGALPEGINPQ